MRRVGKEPTIESLAKKNALLEEEVYVARRASEITSELVVEQFVKLEEMLQQLEKNIDTEQSLRQTLAEKLVEVERREREVAEARAAADAANRAKSTFLANMSHELRTPLNAIIGYSEMLQEEAEDAGLEEFIPDLQKILSSGRHLLNLINEILDLSKIEAGKMELFLESFEVNGLVAGVVSTAEPLVQKKANTLDLCCPDDIGTMHADLTKVRQCLFNLLSNASKFTENGTISFVVEKHVDEGNDIILFHVKDTGIGMNEEQMGKIFQAFQQADSSTTRNFGGTGLGLAISRRFCQMMGGDITVSSELGKGTTFTIQLPMTVSEKKLETSGEAPAVASSEDAVSPEATTVLAIDDDADFVELLQRILGKEGYRVISALGAKEGLELARRIQPDVITLDVMMPGVDVWAVLSDLKSNSKTKDIPVVMVTMVDDDGIGKALGVAEHLTKPVERDRLLGVLKKLCPKKAESILIVEDDDNTREMMWRTLEKEGFKVREAENGRVGIKQVAKQVPQLVLLDIMMPEMDGFEFLLELRRHEEWRNIPVVVVTAKDLSETEQDWLSGHVENIVYKGAYARSDLVNEVKRLVGECVRRSNAEMGDSLSKASEPVVT